ncbi:MAG TPA: FmdB family zinc ribbon protein [Acidimicrobiales bacterium]|nr:FmdB family zinc ribbon protein [Acidimicrobiales bacterium]
MPTYEYRCKDCGELLEVVQSFRDDPLTVCPRCTGTLKKVFQPVGIAFKGQGFYRNDARSASSTVAGASKTSADGSSSSDSSSGSSDSTSGGSSDSSSSSSSDSSSSSGAPSKATSA